MVYILSESLVYILKALTHNVPIESRQGKDTHAESLLVVIYIFDTLK